MPHFSKMSKSNLITCHSKIQFVLNKSIGYIDFSVIEGVRSIERQTFLYDNQLSQTMDSKHLANDEGLSLAVDILPYPFNSTTDYQNRERFAMLAGIILGIAYANKIYIVWGGDWDQTFDPTLTRFYDACHFQLGEYRT